MIQILSMCMYYEKVREVVLLWQLETTASTTTCVLWAVRAWLAAKLRPAALPPGLFAACCGGLAAYSKPRIRGLG
jgi:hypothetical protein